MRQILASFHFPAPRLALVAALLPAACRTGPPDPPARRADRAAAEQVLEAQAARWNEGDLEGFVATYWEGPELTFLGAEGLTRGRDDLLARYRRSYPDAESRGRLSFEVLEFRPLGQDHALLLGRYELERAEPAAGFFTLVMVRGREGWRILHDHSSASEG